MNLLSRRALGATLALALCAASTTATAVNCKKAPSTGEIEECLALEQGKAELKLNKTYKRVLKRVEEVSAEDGEAPGAKRSLVAAQRAWVKFREADCDATYTYHQAGSIRGAMYLTCMTRHAVNRTKDLEGYE
jgi:uncharacterized protein YecT (DUF1311 family)